jgi:hypothetical protein
MLEIPKALSTNVSENLKDIPNGTSAGNYLIE